MARELALIAGALVACHGTAPAESSPAADDAPAFRIDVTPPAKCARGTTCEARLVLTAVNGYKINDEYPFKFVADASRGVTVDGPGRFARHSKTTGTLTIVLRPTAAGTAKVSGVFKLSVCTDDVCKIEAPKIAFDVPVR